MPTDQLNESQLRAVSYSNGPLIVLAGPGTGKTRVIIARLARLLDEGADPESLLALTFSVKAAEQMRTRLAERIGPIPAQRVALHTFHSFGRRLVDRYGDMIGLQPETVLLDSAMSKRLLRTILHQHKLFPSRRAEGHSALIDRALVFIAACRNVGRLPGDALAHAADMAARLADPSPELRDDPDAFVTRQIAAADFSEFAKAYDLFDRACRQQGLFNFDDLLTLPLRLFREKPHVAAMVRDEYRHLLVDEFQDVNPAQIELLRAVAPPRLPSGRVPDLCVVGDDDQAIYGFRGSDPHAFTRFAEIWPDHHIQPLTLNYRSAPDIIRAGNEVIARATDRFAPDKVIAPGPARAHEQGGVEGVVLSNDHVTGQVIAAMIDDDRSRQPDRQLGSYAVIARSNDTLASIAAEMELAGVPVVIRRHATALEDQGVQDLLAWVRLLLDQDSLADAQRLLVRPPVLVPICEVQLWSAAYRRTEAAAHGQGFADWVIAQYEGRDEVRRFAEFLAEFRSIALVQPADRVFEAIVRRVDIAHAEAMEPRARALRVTRLVQVLRFVRSRQPFLDAPGDLEAFWRYYSDLNESEQQFEAPGDERIGAPGADSEDPDDRADAVQLLTAHKSKGLEFDTVFIAKVRPRGFPGIDREGDRYELPEDFSGLREREFADEQRRLFYVACTRAERRLVLLAKAKKSRGKSTDYFDEITQDAVGLSVPLSSGDEWLARAGAPTTDELEEASEAASAEVQRNRLLHREASRIRQEAYAALHDAKTSDPGSMHEVESRLIHAAHLVAGLAALEHRRPLPAFITSGSPEAERLAQIARRLTGQEAPHSFASPLLPPVRLSYSRLTEYQRCPRCFYLKYIMGYDEPKTQALSVGDVVHRSIEQFVLECSAAESDGRFPPGRDRLLAIGAEKARDGAGRTGALDSDMQDQILAQLENYAAYFHDDAQVFKAEGVVTFNYFSGDVAHPFTAKIDRVDHLPDGQWRIADYKTGEAWKKLREPASDDLQLCIYAMALPHMLDPTGQDATIPEGRAEYWLLSTGQRGSISFADLRIDKARKSIDQAIAGMLQGDWPRGANCKHHCAGLWPDE